MMRSFWTARNTRRLLLISLFTLAIQVAMPAQTDTPPQETDAPQQPIPADLVPWQGTFWPLTITNAPPTPFFPFRDLGLPVYALPDGGFLYDDRQVDYPAIKAQALAEAASLGEAIQDATMFSAAFPNPPGGGGGTNHTGGSVTNPPPPYNYPSNTLWVEITGITNAVVYCKIHGTTAGGTYDVFSKTALTSASWTLEQELSATANQDWTGTSLSLSGRTKLFLSIRSWVDSDGSGMPDWWQLQYFGHTGVDPFADADGDGWLNIQEFAKGTNPNGFNIPPPPHNVAARLDTTGTNVLLTWQSGGGPVDHYGVEDGYGEEIGTVSAGTLAFTNSPNYPFFGDAQVVPPKPMYSIRAYFAGGLQSESQAVTVFKPSLSDRPLFFRGTLGQPFVILVSPPANLSRILLSWEKADYSYGSVNLYATNFVKGIAPLPLTAMGGYRVGSLISYQLIATNGDFGSQDDIPPYFADDVASFQYGFWDARAHLKENLKFLLRSATISLPFSYSSNLQLSPPAVLAAPSCNYMNDAGFFFARPSSPVGYEYYGLRFFDQNENFSVLDELRPVQENYLWRNFVYNLTDFSGRLFSTGADYTDDCGIRLLMDPKYQFAGSWSQSPLPLAFTATNSPGLYYRWLTTPIDYSKVPFVADIGGVINSSSNLVVASGVRNYYGLPLNSLQAGTNTPLTAGMVLPALGTPLFPNFASPLLQTIGYYFASQTRYINYMGPHVAVPGSSDFALTNASPILFASVGEPLSVAGWAKQSILNGATNKFAYLEQYFDKAYKMTNGVATTNETGMLSPYGEFLPMEPGDLALVTMPDIETGQRGTGVVHVLKLALDVNHDGLMDTTLTGPDNISAHRPLRFWANNDYDAPGIYGPSDADVYASQFPDYNYSDVIYGYGKPCIHSQRDLEDYARLWVCGIPALTIGGYQVTLSFVNISSGNPAIHLFQSVETNGGTLYLTDTNVAAAQWAVQTYVPGDSNHTAYYIPGPGVSIGTVSFGSTFTFPSNFFTNGGSKYLLFEGAAIGAGQLMLTVSQTTSHSTNVLAQTSTWLDLHDIKNMYQQVHITGVTNTPPLTSFLSSGYQELNALDSNFDEDNNIVVFIHGWRMGVSDYYNFSESMLKRLYWQGYHGRFVSIRWDTLSKDDFKFATTLQSVRTYNTSEFRAWESAKGVSDYLTYLKGQFPNYNLNVCAHSMGNIVMTEGLKLQLAAGQQNVRNCLFMQGAVPASCYDTSFTNYAPMVAAEIPQPTPNTYRGYPGAIGAAVSGHLMDFFNTNDYALATGTLPIIGAINWEANQVTYKPDAGFGYGTDGTNSFRNSVTMTDSREIMSFCARPRSKAVGAQPNVGGVMYIAGQIDLTGAYNFRLGADEHSAEFNWNIQRLGGFYRQLALSFGVLQPSPP